jgi:hypothetical protein
MLMHALRRVDGGAWPVFSLAKKVEVFCGVFGSL